MRRLRMVACLWVSVLIFCISARVTPAAALTTSESTLADDTATAYAVADDSSTDVAPPPDCPTGWRSLATDDATMRFAKFWISCSKNATKDAQTLQKAYDVLASVAPDMIALMGQPLRDTPDKINDDGNDETRIDFYLVGDKQQVKRNHGLSQPIGAVAAVTDATSAYDRLGRVNAESGYVLLRKASVGTAHFKSVLVHEFFHLLQFAYNERKLDTCPGGFWFSEASAVWAQTNFARESAKDEVYPWFAEFQKTTLSLHDSWTTEKYGKVVRNIEQYRAFIWPYFMQQQVGPQAIANAWKATVDAGSCDALMDAVDAQLSFKDNFHTFTLRNLNSKLFGDLAPINPRYNTLDPKFPDGIMPAMNKAITLKANKRGTLPTPVNAEVKPLKAQYQAFNVDKSVQQLVITTGEFGTNSDIDIDAVVFVKGKWEVRSWTGQRTIRICRDSDPVEKFYIVLSNHNKGYDVPSVKGQYQVQSLAQPCGCDAASVEQWRATFTFDYQVQAQGMLNSDQVTASIARTGTFSIVLGHKRGDSTMVSWGALDNVTTGTASIHDKVTYISPNGDVHTITDDGTSTDSGLWSSASLYLNPQTCTLEFHAQTQTNQGDVVHHDSWSDEPFVYPQFGYGGSDVNAIPFSADSTGGFSGSRDVQVLGDSTNPQDIDAFVYMATDPSDEYMRLKGGALDTTKVTWQFTPIEPK